MLARMGTNCGFKHRDSDHIRASGNVSKKDGKVRKRKKEETSRKREKGGTRRKEKEHEERREKFCIKNLRTRQKRDGRWGNKKERRSDLGVQQQ